MCQQPPSNAAQAQPIPPKIDATKPVKVQKPKSKTQNQTERSKHFLKRVRTNLFRGGVAFRNVGVNIPDLFERFLREDDAGATKALTDAHTLGVRLARCWGTTWGPDAFARFERDRAGWLSAFDRMLASADEQGIAIVPSLLWNPHMLPEYVKQSRSKNETLAQYLTPGSASNALAVEYVTAIVTRYKNDPRVLFWEIGNEYNLEADIPADPQTGKGTPPVTSEQIRSFLAQMATLIRKLDKRHLVTSGNADMRPSAWHLRQAALVAVSPSSPALVKTTPSAKPSDASPSPLPSGAGNISVAPPEKTGPDAPIKRLEARAVLPANAASRPGIYAVDWTPDTFAQYVEITRFFNPPPLEIISVHQYPISLEDTAPAFLIARNPDNATNAFQYPWSQLAADAIGLPLFVGEFGQKFVQDSKEQPAPWTTDMLRRLVAGGWSVSALWVWEFHNGSAEQEALSASPTGTPDLAKLLGGANQAIVTDILTTTTSTK